MPVRIAAIVKAWLQIGGWRKKKIIPV